MFTSVVKFFRTILSRKALIWEMAKRDVVQKYAGSGLGLVWSLIHPLAMILIFWFVFGLGLKARPVADVPFVVWLMAGMAIWLSFSEIVSESTTIITNNTHLIKKILFPSQILPVVKIVSALVTHAIFLVLLLLLMLANGVSLTWGAVQFVYYYLAMIVLALGIGWLTAALNVFTRDVAQAVQVILQIGFWATPIIWDLSIMPEFLKPYIKLNPFYYLVQGYRDSFISFRPFWENWQAGVYYWTLALAAVVVGGVVFQRLKPHFDDLL